MKKVIPFILFLFTACNTLPQLYESVEDVATNNAIDISVSKEVVEKEADLTIAIQLNKKAE